MLQGLPDRFYRALYEALLDSRLPLSSKQPLFLNLLFRALKLDRSQARVAAFVKRLIQTLCNQQTPYVIGALHLLGKVSDLALNVLHTSTDLLRAQRSSLRCRRCTLCYLLRPLLKMSIFKFKMRQKIAKVAQKLS